MHKKNRGNNVGQMILFLQMLKCAKMGEVDGISYLYQLFLPGIFGYIYNRVSDRDLAEDLTSDVFVRMVEKIHKVRATDEPSFAAWLFQVARTTIVDYYRVHEKMSCIPFDSIDDTIECPCILGDDPLKKQRYLAEVFNLLTEEQRVVLTGCLMLGYDAETMGCIIGKNANAVRALQFRALKSLKRILSERKDENEIASRNA